MERVAAELCSRLFLNRTRVRALVAVWLRQPLYSHLESRKDIWSQLFRDVHAAPEVKLSKYTLYILPFGIPLNDLTEEERTLVRTLRDGKTFARAWHDKVEDAYYLVDFAHNGALAALTRPALLLQEFARAAFAAAGSFEEFFRFVHSLAQRYARSRLGCTVLASQMDATRLAIQTMFDGWGATRHPDVARDMAEVMGKQLPSMEQTRLFQEALNGGLFRLHIGSVQHAAFHRVFLDTMQLMQLGQVELKRTDPMKHACLIVAIEEEDKAAAAPRKHRVRPRRTDESTLGWYEARNMVATVLRILFGRWFCQEVQSWDEVPRALQHLVMTVPEAFSGVLQRLGRLKDVTWLDHLCMPYLSPQAVQQAAASTPSGDFKMCRISWHSTVFLATRYLVSWHSEMHLHPLETWVSLVEELVSSRSSSTITLPDDDALTPAVAADLRALAMSLRVLFYGKSEQCLHTPIVTVHLFARKIPTALLQHDPGTATATVAPHPVMGRTEVFKTLSLEQLRVCLRAALREHEFDALNWKSRTHTVIYFEEGVSLLDLHYTLDSRCGARHWPEGSWRALKLPGNMVAAVVPTQAFRNGCTRTYLLQRLSTYSTRQLEGAAPKGDVTPLPLYPHIVQAFFSTDPALMRVSIVALYSWITWVRRRTLPIAFPVAAPAVATHDDPAFAFYYQLPHVIAGLLVEGEIVLDLYQHSFLEDNCAFTEDEGRFQCLRSGVQCFLMGLLSALTLKAPHHMTRTTAQRILSQLQKMPEFQRAIDEEKERNAEVRAFEVLVAISDHAHPTTHDIAIVWPRVVGEYEQQFPAIVALYELMRRPYVGVAVRRLIFYGIMCGEPGEEAGLSMSGHAEDVDDRVWFDQQIVHRAELKPADTKSFRGAGRDADAWHVMTDLARVLEFGYSQTRNLKHTHFVPVPQTDMRAWRMPMQHITWLIGPRTVSCPFALLSGRPAWRTDCMLVFASPMSSRATITTDPRPLYSPVDGLLDYVLVQAPGRAKWEPRPLSSSELGRSVELQKLSFPLDDIAIIKQSPLEQQQQQHVLRLMPPQEESKALVAAAAAAAPSTAQLKRQRDPKDIPEFDQLFKGKAGSRVARGMWRFG